MTRITLLYIAFCLLVGCKYAIAPATTESYSNENKGELFIIGGGNISKDIVDRIKHSASLSEGGYMIVLPMSSSSPGIASNNVHELFSRSQNEDFDIVTFDIGLDNIKASQIDSLNAANLIFITGGNQSQFMERIKGTQIAEAIRQAYSKGIVVAGTSAGASLMSKIMITGQQNNPDTKSGEYRSVEANNIATREGLGLAKNLIIDQHFFHRMRMNRLLSLAIEYPDHICLGIAESTCVHIKGNTLQVLGEGQVLRLRAQNKNERKAEHLLGMKDMNLDVLLAGDKINLE